MSTPAQRYLHAAPDPQLRPGQRLPDLHQVRPNRLRLDDLRRQLTKTATLMETRKTTFRERTGLAVSAINVWLQERVKELAALDAIIARPDDEPGPDYVAGAGAYVLLPIAEIRYPVGAP